MFVTWFLILAIMKQVKRNVSKSKQSFALLASRIQQSSHDFIAFFLFNFQTLTISESSFIWKTSKLHLTMHHLLNRNENIRVKSVALLAPYDRQSALNSLSQMVTLKVETFFNWRRRRSARRSRFATIIRGWQLRQMARCVSRRSGTTRSLAPKRLLTFGLSSPIRDITVNWELLSCFRWKLYKKFEKSLKTFSSFQESSLKKL